MTSHNLGRFARVSLPEIGWRAGVLARTTVDRVRTHWSPPTWQRRHLASALSTRPDLAPARAALTEGRWGYAQRELTRHFGLAPQRFVLAQANKPALVARLAQRFPSAAPDAVARANRLLAGEYDLLGYHSLRFDRDGAVDWHADPVHSRRAPKSFWSTVPFLDPRCGDHKIIWELNRHQHWMVLGRAFWLTDDPTYRSRCIWELASWLQANPPLVGINWASMLEQAFRSLSWIWALHMFVDTGGADEVPWIVDLLVGLDMQQTHIERNLSVYFSPNTHLLGEALALYIGGRCLPELQASARREARGRRILINEIDHQICTDGGHYERSTHYHRYALDFYLLALIVARITQDPATARFEEAVSRLATATRLLADDQGRLPSIGDDDGGMLWPLTGRSPADIGDSLSVASVLLDREDLLVGPVPEEAYWLLAHPRLAARLDAMPAAPTVHQVASSALPESGYYVSRSSAGDHLVIDGGPEEYRHAGHAHADALAITLTVRGTPLLIDAGTGCYTVDAALRDHLRSATMHNTLVVDDRRQAIPNGPFRWKRLARTHACRWRAHRVFDYFEGTHDGFQPIEHRRHVFSLPGDLVVVADLVDGTGSHSAATHWHFDPQWTVSVDRRRVTLRTSTACCQLAVPAGVIERFEADRDTGLGWHAPAYGRLEPSTTIRVTHRAAAPFWLVHVLGLDPDNAVIDVERVPVWAEARVLDHGTAVRITRRSSIDLVVLAHPTNAGAGETWRTTEVETDAHLLFCRMKPGGCVERVAMVDGSLVRICGPRPIAVERPHMLPATHFDARDLGMLVDVAM